MRHAFVAMGGVGILAFAAAAVMPAPSEDEVIVAEGTIVTAPRSDVPETADVFAWPSNEALADFEVGDQFNLEPIGSAEVDGDGNFALAVDSMNVLDRMASDQGEVNLFVSADNGETTFEKSFSVNVDEIESASVDSVVDLGDVAATGEAEDAGAADPMASSDAFIEKACTSTKITNLGNKWVPVGGLFSSNTGAKVDYVYESGQSSSLGAAVSQKASNAGFSASGTTSISSTASVNFPAMSGTGNKLAKTQFRYGNYKTKCTFVTGGVPFTSVSYKVRADMWVGGSSFTSVSAPKATYCVSYNKGASFTKSRDTQVTWTGSVEIYGVGLSAQTGWSNNGKIAVSFPNKAGKVCGSGNYATQSNAYQIVAKS
ncbi:hypothetical protein [Microbacterium sp. 1P06AB]|uniref:hypothetical protein n=1 Tax=Microbacterium sp. 1P06AB TaxID=3132289 RepID=UPI0039A542F6